MSDAGATDAAIHSDLLSALKSAEISGNLDDALLICDHLLARSDANEYAAITRVRVLIKLGRMGQARYALEQTKTWFPENVQIDVLAGRLAEKVGNLPEAMARWNAVLTRHPEHQEANHGLVRALLKAGQVGAAHAHARSIPEDLDRQMALARGLNDIGQSVPALQVLDEVLDVEPHHVDALLWKARVLLRFSRLSEAQEALAHLSPDNIDGLVLSARLNERVGDFEKARQSWLAVLEVLPAHREAALSLDVLELKQRLDWSTHNFDLSQESDVAVVENVRRSIVRTKLGAESWWDDAYADDAPTEYREHRNRLESYVERHSYMRYNRSAFTIVPWLASCVDLAGRTVVEVGCGTGSTTAVLAQNCEHVFGYDIDARVLDTAEVRLHSMHIENVSLFCHAPHEIQHAIMQRHSDASIDVVMLYAVVEHQTVDERIEALANAWRLLRPGGHLAVVEAPNRLTYHDWHSSMLPFFHMLPRELQARYCTRSPRSDFARTISQRYEDLGSTAAEELLIRWGQSVSYHDFELVLGELDDLVVADGFHPLIERDKLEKEKKGEGALMQFIDDEQLRIPRAFTRANIDVVLQKPAR